MMLVAYLTPGVSSDNLLNLPGNFFGALQRGCIGKLQIDVEVALILVRQEAGRQFSAEETPPPTPNTTSMTSATPLLRSSAPDTADVTVRGSVRNTRLNQSKNLLQQSVAFFLRLEQQRRQRGAERERVERRQDHRNRDGHGELLVEPAGDSWNECGRHEYRGENQRDADHRPEISSIAFKAASLGASPSSI